MVIRLVDRYQGQELYVWPGAVSSVHWLTTGNESPVVLGTVTVELLRGGRMTLRNVEREAYLRFVEEVS